MNYIYLNQTLPEVFADRDSVNSEVWNRNIRFEKGKSYLIEAASGTGKSSLCSFIYGYRNDYKGIIRFDDTDIRSYAIRQWVNIRGYSISMLFQELRVFPELSALDNVLLKNNLTGFRKKKEVVALFDQLGMSDKVNEKAATLSFGQQQRVAFIRSLCQPCDFILLDEPVSHLDDSNGRIMGEMLLKEASAQGAGVLVTSIGKSLHYNYDQILKL